MGRPGTTPPKLRVIAGNAALDWPPHGVITNLMAHPFRPGETPNLVTLQLGGEARDTVESAARASRLPCALWLRIAVESARSIHAVAGALAWSTERVTNICDDEVERETAPVAVMPLARATLGAYAGLIERGACSGTVPVDGLTVRLSDEIYGSWHAAAAGASRSLEAWAGGLVATAPQQCAAYEIAAARAAATLAEWIYAASLRAAASSIA